MAVNETKIANVMQSLMKVATDWLEHVNVLHSLMFVVNATNMMANVHAYVMNMMVNVMNMMANVHAYAMNMTVNVMNMMDQVSDATIQRYWQTNA